MWGGAGHKEPFQQQFDLPWMHIRGMCFQLFVEQGSTAELCLQDFVGMSLRLVPDELQHPSPSWD